MNRTLLVAKREFAENLRTKTFWLGILAFPVILVLSVVVTRFFADQKEVRKYAVLDLSQRQWLSQAIDQAAADDAFSDVLNSDESKAARAALDADEPIPIDDAIREAEEQLSTLDREKDPIKVQMLELQIETLTPMRGQSKTPKEITAALAPAFFKWFATQDQDKLKSMFTAGKYQRIPLADLDIDPADPASARKALSKAVDDDKLFAFFIVNDDPVSGDDGSLYVSNNKTDNDLRNWYSGLATNIVRERRIRDIGIAKSDAQRIQARFRFDQKKINAETGEETEVTDAEKANSFAPVGFVYLLWIAVFTAAQMLLTNTVEEKSNRIIEVLLSSVSPMQLMAGKIWGIAATGLTIVGSWVLVALIGVKFAPVLFPGLEDFPLMDVIGDPLYLASFVVYFLAGYLLYAAFLVAIGSVCNSLKEAQNLMQPVFIVLVIPMLAMIPIVNDPNGTVAKVMTYIPLFTPFAMMNRAGGPPPAWEYAASGILLVISILIAFWAAGKVFRIGVLMTGKPPKFREILGWIKAPVGAVPVHRQPAEAETS